MKEENKGRQQVDAYIERFPENVRKELKRVRRVIKSVVPDAQERISYGIPTFKLAGTNLVHFAGWKTHLGFYPTSSGITRFRRELGRYETSRGTVKFPLDEPLPFRLIERITRFRVAEVRKG